MAKKKSTNNNKNNNKNNKKKKATASKKNNKSKVLQGKGNATSLDDYGVMNIPHQFTSQADPRDESGWKGRVYSEHILENAPLVLFKMGKPKYLQAAGQSDSNLLASIMEMDDEQKSSYLEELFKDTKKNSMYYYTFESDFDNYCNYVNGMVRYTAVKMGLSNEYKFYNLARETKLAGNSNWFSTFFNSSLGLSEYLAFYCDASGTSVSESGSNSTGDSQLASGVKSLGQTKREIDFLFGANVNANADGKTDFDSYSSTLSKTYSKFSGGIDKILNKMSGTFTSVASGANILFPEVWQDSSFRSSYSVEIKLYSPYGDKESVFRNIYIPFFCLLAMSLPRQAGKQGYTSPFLIQCFSKGWFSCNCGMVESIDVKKAGSGSEWSVDNLPTEVTVSLQIKDLYPTIISSGYLEGTKGLAFSNNLGMTDYLKVMAGVELTDFDPVSNIEEVINSFAGMVTDIPTKIYQKVSGTVGESAQKLITKIFGGMN